MTIERQLELFTEYKAKVGTIPERALYVICSGSNDIVEHFTLADGMSSPEYADMMAYRAITLVEVRVVQSSDYLPCRLPFSHYYDDELIIDHAQHARSG
jgi:hypothetical protein